MSNESVAFRDVCPLWSPPGLPMWRDRGARGKAAWLLHGAADLTASRSRQEIEAVSLVATATARRLLPLLADTDGVLYRTHDGHYRMGEVDPADVVFPDAEEAAPFQRERHDLDHRTYLKSCTDRAERVERNRVSPPASELRSECTVQSRQGEPPGEVESRVA